MTSASNVAASIHQKILNRATVEHRTFNELFQYYAIERFLYRLGQSPYCDRFVLKGALVFLAWQAPFTRPTRDMDLLGFTENSVENLVDIVRDICIQLVEDDGMMFDPKSVTGEIIKEEAEYQGVRVTFLGFLGKAKATMRLDVGFADVVTPPPSELEIPTVLANMSKPCVRVYPPETVIAEKFQAMVVLGMVNSRMKDFYDIWFILQTMELDFHLVKEAISNTFVQRSTVIPKELPAGLTKEFADRKQSMWTSFLKKNQIQDPPENLLDVILVLTKFLDPLVHETDINNFHWFPNKGWHEP